MAVTKPLDLAPGITAADAYFRVNHVDIDSVRGEIYFKIEVYASAAARQKTSDVHARYRAALANVMAMRAACTQAEQRALKIAQDNPQKLKPTATSSSGSPSKFIASPVPKVVTDANAAAEAARAARDAAQAELDAADQARATFGPAKVETRALALDVAAKLIAEKATNDQIVAAIYAQEKAAGLLLAGGTDI